MRQIVLDTETTGLEPSDGHKIIEIGCVELVDRKLTGNHYHQYLKPNREIDQGAIEVHGITNEFLADKPLFEDVVEDFLAFVDGAELIIHNAPFDIGFLDNELSLLKSAKRNMSDFCTVLDTLVLARHMHPGQRNSLDALCKRYDINNEHRELHGALLDSEILADVYLRMTGGQTNLTLGNQAAASKSTGEVKVRRISKNRQPLKVIKANSEEETKHLEKLQSMEKASGQPPLWE